MNRVALLNYLIGKNGYHSYLEIGCASNRTFHGVKANHCVGVDPCRGGTLRMSSDEFFRVNRELFDLIFIDGLHLAEQVILDVDNALACLNAKGCIVLHDCLPQRREQQLRVRSARISGWTGDVWKAVVQLRQRRDCDLAVLGSDWGLGVLFMRPNSAPIPQQRGLTWNTFVENGHDLLRVVDADGLNAFVSEKR